MALLLKMAGIGQVSAVSEDYPGTLLDRRITPPGDMPEPLRMLAVAEAAGFALPAHDDGRLAVRRPLPALDIELGPRFVVAHPGTSAPARAYPIPRWIAAVRTLSAAGWPVAVTGSPGERDITAEIATLGAAGSPVLDLGGRLSLAELASVLDRAAVAVVANTGPAHLAAAVGTAVVSLFAPVVPAVRWAPYGVRVALLGDQHADCRDSRSIICPVPGHPCLSSVTPAEILSAVSTLTAGDMDDDTASPVPARTGAAR